MLALPTRTTFNMFAMIAFIMLMGLVVKNGILPVGLANQARREEGNRSPRRWWRPGASMRPI